MKPLRHYGSTFGPLIAAALAVLFDLWASGTVSEGLADARGGMQVSATVVAAVIVLLYAPMALGARFPVTAFASMWVAALIPALIPGFEPIAGLGVALFLVGRFAPGRVAFMAWLVSLVPMVVAAWNNANDNLVEPVPEDRTGSFLAILVTWIILRTIPVVFGWVLQRYANRVVDQEAELARAAEEARIAERARITQELHDIVAHSLSAMVLQAAGAKALTERRANGDARVGEALSAIEEAGGQAMRELHRLLGLLRGSRGPLPEHQEPLHRRLEEINELVESTRSAGLHVTVETTGTARTLDPSVEHAAYRLVQEGLTNAMKHAGVGARVIIDQDWSERALDLSVRSSDGNKQPAKVSGRNGLVNLAERIHLVGGNFDSLPLPDGFLLKAQFPVRNG